jgi:hypothetical protein
VDTTRARPSGFEQARERQRHDIARNAFQLAHGNPADEAVACGRGYVR